MSHVLLYFPKRKRHRKDTIRQEKIWKTSLFLYNDPPYTYIYIYTFSYILKYYNKIVWKALRSSNVYPKQGKKNYRQMKYRRRTELATKKKKWTTKNLYCPLSVMNKWIKYFKAFTPVIYNPKENNLNWAFLSFIISSLYIFQNYVFFFKYTKCTYVCVCVPSLTFFLSKIASIP